MDRFPAAGYCFIPEDGQPVKFHMHIHFSIRAAYQINFSKVILIPGVYASGVGQTGKLLPGYEKSWRGTAMTAVRVEDQTVF